MLTWLWFLAGSALAGGPSIAGNWAVTPIEEVVNTCGSPPDGGSTYLWIISQQQEKVTVVSQGETKFPKMEGTFAEGKVALTGAEGFGLPRSTVWYELRRTEENLLVGRRVFTGKKGNDTCFVETTYRAKPM